MFGTLLWVLAALPAAAAQGLDDAVRKADGSAAAGDYRGARTELRALLDREELRSELLARYPELRARLADWAFAEKYPEMQISDLVSGEVKAWNDKKLNLKLRYAWDADADEKHAGDFLKAKKDWLFRLPAADAIKLTISGDWNSAEPEPVSLIAGYDPAQKSGWRITPGFHRTKIKPDIRMPLSAERFGEPYESLAKSSEGLDEPAGKWSYTLEVKKGEFLLKKGSKKLGAWKTKYPELVKGLVGFQAPGLSSVEIEADFDAAGYARRQEEVKELLSKRFRDQEYDPLADLPPWLVELHRAADAATDKRPPADAPQALADAWPELLASGLGFPISEFCQKAGVEEGGALGRYCWAIFLANQGSWATPARLGPEARGQGLEHGALWALEAQARFYSGDGPAAARDLAGVLERWPTDVGWALASLEGRILGPRAMLKRLDAAIAAGGVSRRILDTRDRLAAVLAGPDGTAPRDTQERLVQILSEDGPEAAKSLQAIAGEHLSYLQRRWPKLLVPAEPLLVLHFLEESALRDYCGRLRLEVAGVPCYHPELRTLMVVDADPQKNPDQERLKRWVGFQFLAGSLDLDHVPPWFVEGCSILYSSARQVSGEMELQPIAPLLRLSDGNEEGMFFQPFELLKLPRSEWDKNRGWAECESYLLAWFLDQAAAEPYAGALDRYLEALLAGKNGEQAFDELFGKVDAAALYDDFNEFRQQKIDALHAKK